MLETDDPVKSQLLRKASQQREELESEVNELSKRTEKIVTNALLIGGSLALAYFAFRGLSGKKTKRKIKKAQKKVVTDADEGDEMEQGTSVASTVLSEIGHSMANQATMFLLDLAKEKLAEYLHAQAERKKNEHS